MTPIVASLAALVLASSPPLPAQERPPVEVPAHDCARDLTKVGQMEDILSNALMLGLGKPEARVIPYLQETRADCESGDELLRRAAVEFSVEVDRLRTEVERFRHVNCGPSEADEGTWTPEAALTPFASDVLVHVVLHEIGHGLVREFDLPVLGNEETLADAFATHYLVTHLPERAPAVLRARVASLWFEAGEVPREQWDVDGEHDSDARRAHLIASLAVAADPARYAAVADVVAMSDEERGKARDWGSEIHRSWRRVLRPLWMPDGQPSSEARVTLDVGDRRAADLRASGLLGELEHALRRFDWHSQVTLRFASGDGGAAWSRSKRTITVREEYLRRFVRQGQALAR